MVATWPISLPTAPLASGVKMVPQSITERSEVAQGRARIRQRTSRAVKIFNTPVAPLTAAQVDTLYQFWESECKGSSIEFDWIHPLLLTSARMRFYSEPEFTPIQGSTAVFRADFQVEVLPT